MPTYVLNRNYTLRTTMGHSVAFKKGEPVFVPKLIEREALKIGAERVDGAAPDLLEPEAAQVVPLTPDERNEQITAAFALLIERNDSKDFTAAGVPTVKAVEKLVGFDVERSEVADAWAEMRAAA